jgi:lysozyme family protein
MSAFDQAFEIVIGHEGGYTNNPDDPGGETKYGISKKSYPNVDIANLTEDQAKQIYKSDYWDKLSLDSAHPGLALIAFDAAVNNGVSAATKWLQGALGVTADGVFGSQSQAALSACTVDKAQATLFELHAQRINMMAKLPTWKNFGLGWSRRLAQLPFQAAAMTANSQPEPITSGQSN